MYQEILANEKRITVPQESGGSFISWFVFVIRLADRYTQAQRDRLLTMMTQRGIQVNNYFPPVYLQPFIAGPLGLKAGRFPGNRPDLGTDDGPALPQQHHTPAGNAGLRRVATMLRRDRVTAMRSFRHGQNGHRH